MISYRLADEIDRRAVVGMWLDAYRTANAAGLIHMDDWIRVMNPQLNRLVDLPQSRVVVAYETDEPRGSDIYGWAAGVPSQKYVLFVYVKEAFRRNGMARTLFAELGIDPRGEWSYACRTGIVARLAEKIPRAQWKPLHARFLQPEQS